VKKIITAIAITAAFSACMSPGNKVGVDNRSAKNQEIMRKFYEEVMNKHNTAMVDSLVASDYVEHCIDPGYTPDRNGLRKGWEDFIKGYPDLNCKINFMVADTDCVTVQYTITGTNTGSVMGMAATGKKINVDGVDIVRFKNGKAFEHWGYMDEMKMMAQLGMSPGMGGGTDTTKAKMLDGDSKKM
jgi:steroid delta-isomerase-like uncharacterized protein